jgi:dTDP-4-dehydrorhamnose reductase
VVEKTKKIVLVTGSSGMLGEDLVECLKERFKVVALTRQKCDITDKKKVVEVFKHYGPWVVIHTASFTDVDGCQKDRKKAYCVNVRGTDNVAKAAALTGAVLIYVSSDYVFSGKKRRPYRETDKPHPLNVYARTKYQGEEVVRRLLRKHIIIRTSWLFGAGRMNFIDNVLRWAKDKDRIKIVADKYASPTYSMDLSRAALELLELMSGGKWKDAFYGTYHIVNSGDCSWYEYARFILKAAKINKVKVEPISISEMNFAARRPAFSTLDNSKYSRLTKRPLRCWQEAVKEYIECRYN